MTILLILILLVTIVTSLLLSTWFLLLGTRLAKIPAVTFRRALVLTVIAGVLGLAIDVVIRTSGLEESEPILAIVLGLSAFPLTWLVLQRGLRTTFGRAILAWLPTLLAGGIMLGAALVYKAFIAEAYVIPTNAMAPTIAGDHLVGRCPLCEGELFMSAPFPHRPAPEEQLGICASCLQMSIAPTPDTPPESGDRIISWKILNPSRWDIITFQNPADPETMFVKRLVGLPGEEVVIRDGEVWIDGKVVEKPANLKGLVYTTQPKIPGRPVPESWGPAKLGMDEYLVLGDFSNASADSRMWHSGAPGHPPYAVPAEYLDGVVKQIYWPPSRWREL